MTEEEEKIFHQSVINNIPQLWERMKWIKEQERKIDIESFITWEITQFLYNSGTYCYVYGKYASSILSIASAIDSFLASIISSAEFLEITHLSGRIKKAKEYNKISTDIAEELIVFNEKIRNHLVHPKGQHTHYFLGGEFDAKAGKWSKDFRLEDIAVIKNGAIIAIKMDPNFNMRQVCEYSVLLFMRTVRDHLNLRNSNP